MNRQEIATRLTALRQSGRIRLDDEECAALAHALDNVPASEIAHFGSRVQPDRRGGDIDVLLLTEAPAFETYFAIVGTAAPEMRRLAARVSASLAESE